MNVQSFETLKLAVDGHGVARLTLSRPAAHNALNAELIAGLTAAVHALEEDGSVRRTAA